MKKTLILLILSTILFSCKAQEIKNRKRIFTQYCEEAMFDSNMLILSFVKIDSLFCTSPDFGDFFLKKANCGTKLKNGSVLRITSLHKKIDLPTIKRTETLFVYKNKQVMEIHLNFYPSSTYNHCSYVHSIPFVEGKYEMGYMFPSKYENVEDNSFYKDMPKDYFENEQELKDFSNLKFNYINFLKDKNKFSWKKKK
ncbi:hypothetical protein [Tenacibaculum ovolyticum]|uniref:hypothetical protein n=1 Tax=Tenacibaculum ovolyticum TaxID=104270 RepID=UPI001F1EBE19|nr:hypothetical protein [Tenacibaculum ovolyticum]